MSGRLALAVLAAGLLIAGCGQAKGARSTLARYIENVDGVESALRTPLQAVTRTGKQFADEQSRANARPDARVETTRERALLADAERIQTLGRKLAAITPPPEAAHLRALLLALTDRQTALTRETARMVAFIPRYGAELTPLNAAMHRLEPALAASSSTAVQTDAAKAAALRRFASSLEGILVQLRNLQPPAVSEPGYRSEVHGLTGMSQGARNLADALEGGQSTQIEQSLRAFSSAAAGERSRSAQEAQIAAVRSYDGQVAALTRLAESISAERQRLADTVR
jgi:hypothetical protein